MPSALKKAVTKKRREAFIEQWVELGYPEDGWSLDDSWPWAKAGIEAVFARAWRREGCDVETAKRWVAVGHDTPKYIADSIAEGQTLEVLEARRKSR
jgi:hypothetical protein